jgi:hypothetical protein
MLQYVERGVEINAPWQAQIHAQQALWCLQPTTDFMIAEKDLHRNSCCFRLHLSDILNEILSGKQSRGSSFSPTSPASARIPDFTRSPEKCLRQKCRAS